MRRAGFLSSILEGSTAAGVCAIAWCVVVAVARLLRTHFRQRCMEVCEFMCEHLCQKDFGLLVCIMVRTGKRLLKMKNSEITHQLEAPDLGWHQSGAGMSTRALLVWFFLETRVSPQCEPWNQRITQINTEHTHDTPTCPRPKFYFSKNRHIYK